MGVIHIIEFRNWKTILSHQDAQPPAIWFFLGTDYRSITELKTGIGTRLREIEFGNEYHETVNEFRQLYVDYIATLNASDPSSLDRYSGFSEKGPFISSIFQNACFIRLALRILQHNPDCAVFIICQEKVLAFDLSLTLKNAGIASVQTGVRGAAVSFSEKVSAYFHGCARIAYTGLHILSRMLLRSPSAARAERMLRQGSDTIIIHTWMSRNSYANGVYTEGFFGDLQEKLTGLGYMPVLIPHIPYDISYKQSQSALDRSGKIYVPEEHFLSLRALVWLIGSCIIHTPHWKDHVVDGTVISSNVYYQGYRDWQNLQLLMPLEWDAIIKNFSDRGFRLRSFILLQENFSFEKAIIGGLRRCCGGTSVIGYQHSTVTSNHISYCLSKNDYDRQYLPDLVIANGTFPRDALIRNNYPAELVVAGGALRYRGNAGTNLSRADASSSQEGKYTILTLPGVLDESVELLEKVYEALGSGSRKVIATVHPFVPVDRLRVSVTATVWERFELLTEPLDRLLPGADLLIYTTSSTCIDALSHGIPVLRVLSDRRLDIDPLLDFRHKTPYIGVATHPREIADAMQSLSGRTFSEEEKRELARIVESIFGPVTRATYALFTYSKTDTPH